MIHSATFRQNTPQLFSTGTETKFWEQVGIYCLKFAGQHRVLLVKPTISIIYTKGINVEFLCPIMSTLRTREKSFPNFCNVKNSGMTFLWPPPHKVASTRNVTSGSPGGPPHKVASTRAVTATYSPRSSSRRRSFSLMVARLS